MLGNDDGDNNGQYEISAGHNPALMRSNKNQGASGSGSSPKKGASDDGKRGRSKKGKESTQRNVVVIHQPHLLLLQKIILLKKKKKASKKRERHRRKKSSSSSNVSDTETYFDTEPFKVISEADKYKYNLPAKIASYANEQFHSDVKDTDIKQQILLANPVPENLNKAQKFNEFVKDILKEKHKQNDVDQDATFERIQCKNINVMGPLSKLWLLIQNALSSQEEEVPIELNKVKEYVE